MKKISNLVVVMKTKLFAFFKKRGYLIIKTNQYNQDINYYRDVFIEKSKKGNCFENKIDSIVFSKDRAMQLHAFLTSYVEKVQDYGAMYILYKASNEKHKKSYEDLKHIFVNYPFEFIEENEFRSQLIKIVSDSVAKLIGFYVDDMIFLKKINYNDILNIPSLNNVVTLSRGKEMHYSVVLQREIDLPDFIKMDNGMLMFNWDQYEYLSDWTYPLGVSGYFYGRDEIMVMLNSIPFKAPNSLESGMQKFRNFFLNRNGVCYENITCCCVHANIVQTECINPTIGSMTVENLLSEWENGKMIDLNDFYDKSGDVAQFQNYSFIDR